MQDNFKNKNKSSQRGLTLIEVLVVLIILTIGILSILRLFPTGFQVVKNAQNNTIAQRLGQSLLASVKDGTTMPDAVYSMYTDSNGVLGFDPNVNPDNLGAYTQGAQFDVYSNDLNKARYIQGENFSIPTVSPGRPNAIHVLNFGPIFLPDPTNPGNYLKVNSAPWTEKLGNYQFAATPADVAANPTEQPDVLLSLGAAQFLIDYNNKRIAFPSVNYIQKFTFTLRGTTTTVPEQTYVATLTVPANSSTWIDPTTVTPNPLPTTWTPGTAQITRPFTLVSTTAVATDPDPYEYAIPLSSSSATYQNIPDNYPPTSVSLPTAHNVTSPMSLGVLQFNPLGAAHNGLPALQVSASYVVFNWHILHEDHDLAGTDSETFRTIVAPIKKLGSIGLDGTLYAGIAPAATGTTQYDIALMDLDTGQFIANSSSIHDTDNDNPASGTYAASYQTGRFTLPSGFGSKHIRVFYEGAADWGVALQKAPRLYTALSSSELQSITEGGFEPNVYYASDADQLIYFPACDAGKSVLLAHVNYTSLSGGPNTSGSASSVQATISQTLTSIAGVQGQVAYVRYRDLNLLSGTGNLIIDGVSGLSTRAVTIWRESGQWKQRSLDSFQGRAE